MRASKPPPEQEATARGMYGAGVDRLNGSRRPIPDQQQRNARAAAAQLLEKRAHRPSALLGPAIGFSSASRLSASQAFATIRCVASFTYSSRDIRGRRRPTIESETDWRVHIDAGTLRGMGYLFGTLATTGLGVRNPQRKGTPADFSRKSRTSL